MGERKRKWMDAKKKKKNEKKKRKKGGMMTTREVLLHAESAETVWGVRDCSVAARRHILLNITFRKKREKK